ncbi:STAS domain-containing protein [Amycolatopsis sp., V23-08]|uniref:STAS domain-containing protein n=1 Tax=Amycolatopsis heterodermiae TaxID=3110235 RepID=A0ABU5RBC9_9PSEU|nr:STAS domain-containing protein [Amycolatopsis sp., V23-08]MEA5363536.1 STAS domain-containing protein [Amycolatopsis sp., V23-08]
MSTVPLPGLRDPAPVGTFAVTTTADSTVVSATGELDVSVIGHFTGILERELGLRPRVLVVDASAVTFCAARALTVLINAASDAHAAGVPFAVVTRSRAVLRPLTVLGLERVLPVHGDLAAALDWLALLPALTSR